MRALPVVLGVWLAGAATLAAAESQDDSLIFSAANEAFRQANEARASDPDGAFALYRRAALRYERLVEERGIRNGKLYYNLGNAYFQIGDLGRAILNYRRAALADPSDEHVQANLAFARTRRQDRIEPESGGQVVRTLLFWHFEWSRATRVRLFAIAWVLLWTVLVLRFFGQHWVPREIAPVAAVAALLMAASLVVDAIDEAGSQAGVILAPETVARQGDGASYEPAFRDPLHSGTEFEVLEQRPGWIRAELPDGQVCWLDAGDIGLVR